MSDGNIILAVKTWETKLATESVKKYLTSVSESLNNSSSLHILLTLTLEPNFKMHSFIPMDKHCLCWLCCQASEKISIFFLHNYQTGRYTEKLLDRKKKILCEIIHMFFKSIEMNIRKSTERVQTNLIKKND